VNKTKSQSGSAHLIIIMILSLALMGVLGFVYYQNFMQPKASDTINIPVVEDPAVSLNKSITETVTGGNLTLNYPSDWIVVSQTILNPDQINSNEKIFITSPDTNVKITFWAGVDGLGGYCDPETAGTFTSVKVYGLPNYTGNTLYETTTSERTSGAYVLTNNDAIQVGNSECKTGIGFFKAKNGTGNQLGISFQNVLSERSQTAINSARETDNYKTAVKIVQSLHEQ